MRNTLLALGRRPAARRYNVLNLQVRGGGKAAVSWRQFAFNVLKNVSASEQERGISNVVVWQVDVVAPLSRPPLSPFSWNQ